MYSPDCMVAPSPDQSEDLPAFFSHVRRTLGLQPGRGLLTWLPED